MILCHVVCAFIFGKLAEYSHNMLVHVLSVCVGSCLAHTGGAFCVDSICNVVIHLRK